MGFTNMANLTHDMENVLQAIRNNEVKFLMKLLTFYLSVRCFRYFCNHIIDHGSEGSTTIRI